MDLFIKRRPRVGLLDIAIGYGLPVYLTSYYTLFDQ